MVIYTDKPQGQRLLRILDYAAAHTAQDLSGKDLQDACTFFQRGSSLFRVQTEYVREVVHNVSIHSVPGANGHYVGIGQYHGQICPCMDLEKQKTTLPSQALAISYKNHIWFLIIDSLLGIGNMHDAKAIFLDVPLLASEWMQETVC